MCALLVAANVIPDRPIIDNLRRWVPSANYEWSPTGAGIDYFTECVATAMGLASGQASGSVRDAFMSPTVKSCAEEKKLVESGNSEAWNYWRFWHGYQVFSRPLLALVSLRALSGIVFASFCISAFVFYESIRARIGATHATCALAALLCVPIYSGAYLVSHALLWITGFLAAAWLVRTRAASDRAPLDTDLQIFLVLGMIASFVGFLTTPLVTLTMPLLALYWIERGGGAKSPSSSLSRLALCSLTWVVGYSACWAVKWAIAFAFFNVDVLGEGLAQVSLRLTGEALVPRATDWVAVNASAGNSYRQNLWEVRYGLLGLAGFLAFSLARARWQEGRLVIAWPFKSASDAGSFAIVFALPLLWLGIVRNHSIVHSWFVAPILYTCFVLAFWLVTEAVGSRSPRCEQAP
jgi:hypothetical protein